MNVECRCHAISILRHRLPATKGEGGGITSPVGGHASRQAAIPISERFNLGYYRAKPGGAIRRLENVTKRDSNGSDSDVRDRWRRPEGRVHGQGYGRVGRRRRRATLLARG